MTVDQLQKKWGQDLALWTRGEMCKDIISALRDTAPCFNVAGVSELEIQAFGTQRFASLRTGDDILKRLSRLGEPQDEAGEPIRESYPDELDDK